jgi:alcohol dehydrogenase class IV
VSLPAYDFGTVPRIRVADGGTRELGAIVRALGVRRALVVTDRGLVGAGLVQPALDALAATGVAHTVFDAVEADPPEAIVRRATDAARGADGVIGLGGGSSLDTAKLTALLARTPQPLDTIYGIGRATGTRLPLVQVPTTAGTGSEVTPIAIVTTPAGGKQGVVSPLLFADVALLDATLTLGLPPSVTAMTGIDAMVHAIEAYTSRRLKNPMSDALAVRALAMLSANLPRVLARPAELAARRAMLEGSLLAGMAFTNAPVAAVHALAYPLGGLFHVPHGHANALVLAPVLAFNAPAAAREYGELAAVLRDGDGAACDAHTADAFVAAMTRLVRAMPFAQRLRDVGVREHDLDRLAADALAVQRLLVNNPREVTLADARALYAEAL